MSAMAKQIAHVRERLQLAAERVKRDDEIELLAVTKTVPIQTIAEAFSLGLRSFGESRVQEALPKIECFRQADWHFLGQLQTNKVKDVVGRFTLIHSLDRWNLAVALQEQAQKMGQTVRVLVQVNIGKEVQKGGVYPEDLQDFLIKAASLSRLRIEGLMAVPPASENAQDARPFFREMGRLFRETRVAGVEMNVLSMGMSNDYEVAVEEGATLVRVGSVLFGERL